MITYDEPGVIYDASNYTYDGYGLTSDIVSDGLVVSDNTKKSLLRTIIENITTNELFNKSLFKRFTDSIKVSDNTLKSLLTSVTDSIKVSEVFYKSLSIIITDLIKLTDSAGKFIKDTIYDALSIVDNTVKSLSTTIIDNLSVSEIINRCKNGFEIIWEHLTKPSTSWTHSNTKPSTSWTHDDKPNKC